MKKGKNPEEIADAALRAMTQLAPSLSIPLSCPGELIDYAVSICENHIMDEDSLAERHAYQEAILILRQRQQDPNYKISTKE